MRPSLAAIRPSSTTPMPLRCGESVASRQRCQARSATVMTMEARYPLRWTLGIGMPFVYTYYTVTRAVQLLVEVGDRIVPAAFQASPVARRMVARRAIVD